ncbi:MAG: co-chaperone GroES [Eubacterium sp.]|nr:co-chaperone GroES [Eubacterium sp.]
MKIKPLFDKVVLEEIEAEETTKSGIILTSESQEKPMQATVVAVGPGVEEDGDPINMVVGVGDKVVYSKYAGSEVKVDDKEYIIVKQTDILAILED